MGQTYKHTSQYIDNQSFDEVYQQAAVEILTENTAGTSLERQKTIAKDETLKDFLFDAKLAGIDDADATYTYLGYLKKDGAWLIQRIPNAGGEVYYAVGASGWNWSSRASASYGQFDTMF